MDGNVSISPTWTKEDGAHMKLAMPASLWHTRDYIPAPRLDLELLLCKEVGIIMKLFTFPG